MSAPEYTDADYLRALQALMPQGRVWPKDPDAIQTKVLSGLSQAFKRIDIRASQLLVDAFPKTAYGLLPEWEETLGLPDSCSGLGTTTQARQAEVLAKFLGTGGQSAPYFIAYALHLGYTITITQLTPFRMGQQSMGCQLGDSGWAHVWAINAPATTVIPFRMGLSAMGEALQSWGNAALQCSMDKVAPAHTVLQFRYI